MFGVSTMAVATTFKSTFDVEKAYDKGLRLFKEQFQSQGTDPRYDEVSLDFFPENFIFTTEDVIRQHFRIICIYKYFFVFY